MSIDSAGLRVLQRPECVHLLRTATVGRVALSHRALPMILPVHYRLVGDDSITIETTAGSTLHRATDRAVVAFEAEGPPGATEPSWSVIVHGVATHRDREGHDGSRAGIAISIEELSGREVIDLADVLMPRVTSASARWSP